MPFLRRTTVLLATSLAIGAGPTACAHDSPAEPGTVRVDTIPDVGPPERITLNRGKDAFPAWAPDGQSVWYSWEQLERPDRDLCLGRLPVGGGTRTDEVCHLRPAANPDSVNWYAWPAPHPDGRRIAWFRLSALRSASEGGRGEVVLSDIAALGDQSGIRPLSIYPLQIAPGNGLDVHFHVQPVSLRWANDSTLIYLAVLVTAFNANGLAQDTFYSGRELGTLTLSGDSVRHGYVPGTDSASGFTLAGGDTIYFTRNGESAVYRTTLAGAARDTLFDLGAAGTARDPVARGGAVYAVVGGDVSYAPYDNIGYLQHDGGGALWRVDSAGAVLVDNTHLWRHPVLSPDGSTLVIEGRDPFTLVTDLFLLRIDP